MKFFGRTVSDTGCEIVLKSGTRYTDDKHPSFGRSWMHDQVVAIRPLGYHTNLETSRMGYSLTLLKFPNINYTTLGGRWQEDWKKRPQTMTLWDKTREIIDINGKYEIDLSKEQAKDFEPKRTSRDWLIDTKLLSNMGLLTEGEYTDILNHSVKSIITIPNLFSLDDILKNEDEYSRLDPSVLEQHGSVAEGLYTIGSGSPGGYDGQYDDWSTFEADIAAPMTGDLTGEGQDEEIAGVAVIWNQETATFLLKLTAAPGAEHNGGAYGNGARIDTGGSNGWRIDEATADSLKSIEVSKLAWDSSGSTGYVIWHVDAGEGGEVLINRNLIKGGANTVQGIRNNGSGARECHYYNNTIYDVGSGGGIESEAWRFCGNVSVYNNTIINCESGIKDNWTSSVSSKLFKNNLMQGNTIDWDVPSGAGTAKNITEDATSPDSGYASKDVHTNSVFVDYANDDFKIDKDGDSTNLAIIDDGEDLSGTFTDDIVGNTREVPWDIGASQRSAGAEPVALVVRRIIMIT